MLFSKLINVVRLFRVDAVWVCGSWIVWWVICYVRVARVVPLGCNSYG